jgi:hypothetical protein
MPLSNPAFSRDWRTSFLALFVDITKLAPSQQAQQTSRREQAIPAAG